MAGLGGGVFWKPRRVMRREVLEMPWLPVEDMGTRCELQAAAEGAGEGAVAARCHPIGQNDPWTPSCPNPVADGPGMTSGEAGRPAEALDARPLVRSEGGQGEAV